MFFKYLFSYWLPLYTFLYTPAPQQVYQFSASLILLTTSFLDLKYALTSSPSGAPNYTYIPKYSLY